ncbi:MAG: DUF4304 domain-containing protein [Pseudomonadota bacterium]
MTTTRRIRAAIKTILEPHLSGEGFTGKYPHFQRIEKGRLHLLSVVHDQYGGGFVLEFAQVHPGPFQAPWGAIIPQVKLNTSYTAPDARARLVNTARGQGTYDDFFRYDDGAMDRNACETLVSRVVSHFPQINDWLRAGEAGQNIATFSA